MKYLSTRNSNLDFSFFEILFQGLSKDGGLFLPHQWPSIDIHILKNKTYQEVALEVIHPYVFNEISKNDLKNLNSIEINELTNPSDFIKLRAESDSAALKKKFSNEEIYKINLPSNSSSR